MFPWLWSGHCGSCPIPSRLTRRNIAWQTRWRRLLYARLRLSQTLHETWARQKTEVENLKGSLRQLNEKIEEAKRKKNLLVARQKRAEAQSRIQQTMSSLSDKSAFESFERMTEKIEEVERKALAAAELSEEIEGDELSHEFAALEIAGGSADQQLLELKKKMGMLPAGESEERRQLAAGESDDIDDAEIVEEEGAEETD